MASTSLFLAFFDYFHLKRSSRHQNKAGMRLQWWSNLYYLIKWTQNYSSTCFEIYRLSLNWRQSDVTSTIFGNYRHFHNKTNYRHQKKIMVVAMITTFVVFNKVSSKVQSTVFQTVSLGVKLTSKWRHQHYFWHFFTFLNKTSTRH